MKYTLTRPDKDEVCGEFELEPQALSSGVSVDRHGSNFIWTDGTSSQRFHAFISSRQSDGSFYVATGLGSFKLALNRGGQTEGAGLSGSKQKTLKSSMPGKVVKILCSAGDTVAKDQPLMIIEAMKMENEIRSPLAGVISEVGVEAGQKVETGQVLVRIDT